VVLPVSKYIPDTYPVPEPVNHSLGSLTELCIPKSLLDRAYRYPCKELDKDGNIIRIIDSHEQLAMYKEWVARNISYGWTKISLSRGVEG